MRRVLAVLTHNESGVGIYIYMYISCIYASMQNVSMYSLVCKKKKLLTWHEIKRQDFSVYLSCRQAKEREKIYILYVSGSSYDRSR